MPVLARLVANGPLGFMETGSLTNPDQAIYLASSEMHEPGIVTHEAGSAFRYYVVSHRDAKNCIRRFVWMTVGRSAGY